MTRWHWLAIGFVAVAVVVGLVMASARQQPLPLATTEPSPPPTLAASPTFPPGASSTGVPAGLRLTHSGSLTITVDGTVVDGLNVTGEITVNADNVIIRNSLIQSATRLSPIMVMAGSTGVLIEHVEVDNLNSRGIGVNFKPGSSGTVRFANIHSGEDGIRISSSNVTIEYCYVHDLFRTPEGHHDSIQIRAGDNIVIRHNNLQAYVRQTKDPMNASLQIGSLATKDRISNLLVESNLMNGGNFTINGGKDGVESAIYRGNRFGRDFRYGVRGNMTKTSLWDASNVWDDDGRPVE